MLALPPGALKDLGVRHPPADVLMAREPPAGQGRRPVSIEWASGRWCSTSTLTGWSIPNFPGCCTTWFSPSSLRAASQTGLVELLAVQSLPGRLKGAAPRLGPSKRAQGLGRGKPATFSRRAERSVLELTGRSRTQSRPSRLVDHEPRCGALEVALQKKAALGCPSCAHARAAHIADRRVESEYESQDKSTAGLAHYAVLLGERGSGCGTGAGRLVRGLQAACLVDSSQQYQRTCYTWRFVVA